MLITNGYSRFLAVAAATFLVATCSTNGLYGQSNHSPAYSAPATSAPFATNQEYDAFGRPVEWLRRPADVLLAEDEADRAAKRLGQLLLEFRDLRNKEDEVETAIGQEKAGLPHRARQKGDADPESVLTETRKALDFIKPRIQVLSARLDSSWLRPIYPGYQPLAMASFPPGPHNVHLVSHRKPGEEPIESALTELQVTIRTSAGAVILPYAIAVRTPSAIPRVSFIELETGGFTAAMLPGPGKYTLGWQLSHKSAVDSCSFELTEAGTYHLDVTVNRMGTENKVEVKKERLKESALMSRTGQPSG